MSVTAIIQARSNSSRFNRKMQAKLYKHEILEWVLLRLKKSKKINKFVIATTHKKEDLPIVKLGKKLNFKVFKGDEKDVLKRFYLCAKKFKSRKILRVCADNPLIDSHEVDRLISFFSKNKKYDYVYNTMKTKENNGVDGLGAEIFNFEILKKIFFKAKSKDHREHVTKFIRDHKNLFSIKCIEPAPELAFPYLNFDINTPKDFNFIENIIKKFKVSINTSGKKVVKFLISNEIDKCLKKLFPLNRSLTGDDNLKTLKEINKITPIKIKTIPTGKKVYDWKIPKVWKVKEAWIKELKNNKKIVNFKDNNLSLVNYSTSYYGKLNGLQLKKKLYYHKILSNALPYKTTYFKKDWGFCVNKKTYNYIKNKKKKFEIKIDTSFKSGKLIYGECLIKGKSKKEVLISTYICHPSMANDNLSGVILTAFLTKFIKSMKNRYWSYRIIFIPETIGAISYLNINEKLMKKINFGLVISNVGGKGKFSFKESFNKDHFLNDLVKVSLKKFIKNPKSYPFDINGSDERQYSSQFFKINICSIFKDKYYDFKQYHSSLDNLNFVKAENIYETLKVYQYLIQKIERQIIYKSIKTACEPMLSKYDLYPKLGGNILPSKHKLSNLDLILWLLFLSNGDNTIDQISNNLKVNKNKIQTIYNLLKKKKLIERV